MIRTVAGGVDGGEGLMSVPAGGAMDRISVPGEPALTKTVGIPPVEVELPITFSRSWLRKLFGPAQAALGLLGGFLAVLVLLVTPDTLSTHGLLWAVLFTCLAVMVAVLAAAFLQSAVSNIAVDFFEKEGVLSITSEGILDRRISLHRIAWPEIRSGKKSYSKDIWAGSA